MNELTLNGHTYRYGKLSAMAQFHLSRKIAPILPALSPLFSAFMTGRAIADLTEEADDTQSVQQVTMLLGSAGPLADALAGMNDADAEDIIARALAVVQRQSGTSWAAVMPNGILMFDDMGLDTLLPLVAKVVQDSLGPFIKGLVTNLTQDRPAQ